MNRNLEFIIGTEYDQATVGAFLKNHGISHPILVHLKKTAESILVNGEWVYVTSRLHAGDILTLRLIETDNSPNIPAVYIPRDAFASMVVYEDTDILVLNKPAGLPVHPSLNHHQDTLANFCAYYYANYSKEEGAFVYRCVNRLDRDTSGLVLIAKNMYSSSILSNSQLEHGIQRTYLAICEGKVPESGVVDLPIARREASVIERCVDMEKGETAITHFRRLNAQNMGSDDCFSLVMLQLETGRTHQIRVHMKAIGHPLPGDFLYNPDYRYINRQALHSYSLEFEHPVTGEHMCFTQEPPEDFFLRPRE